jgi:hypothetical protein
MLDPGPVIELIPETRAATLEITRIQRVKEQMKFWTRYSELRRKTARAAEARARAAEQAIKDAVAARSAVDVEAATPSPKKDVSMVSCGDKRKREVDNVADRVANDGTARERKRRDDGDKVQVEDDEDTAKIFSGGTGVDDKDQLQRETVDGIRPDALNETTIDASIMMHKRQCV